MHIDPKSYVPPPPPSLNGGLYTGEPFKKGAPYANIPVTPDAGYMIHYNLRSANPPLDALFQYPGNIRPGNNFQTMPGIKYASEKYNLLCTANACGNKTPSCPCNKCKLFKYAYL